MSDETRVRLLIRGRVQGVGYRDWTVRTARDFGVEGWVRNRHEGTVEAVFSGPADSVDGMVTACRQGPSSARVDGIERFDVGADEAGAGGFEQRSTA